MIEEDKKEETTVAGKQRVPFTNEQRASMFKDLAHMSYYDVIAKYKLDEYYANKGAARLGLVNIVRQIVKAPDLYGISREAADIVQTALNSRNPTKGGTPNAMVVAKEMDSLSNSMESLRDKAIELMHNKLDKIKKNKDELDGIKLKELMDVVSSAIDKTKVIKGETADHVIHYSKIDVGDVSPQEALKLVLKAREALIEQKK